MGDALREARYGEDDATLTAGNNLSILARLFALGASVPRGAAAAALEPVGLTALEQGGMIETSNDGRVSSPVRITPYEGLVFLHDRPDPHGPSNQVAPVGPASKTLASLTIRAPVDRALDLGTGCGVQALLLARHAQRVIATDVSDRALSFARTNAAMNRIENVELRPGDLFEPVRGERFDVIAANPPFVISPETSHVFRDSTLAGDDVSRQVVAGAGKHLREGGYATVLCEWLQRGRDTWRDVPERWTDGRGCDTLALHYRTQDPETYAAAWNARLRDRDPESYVETVERWADYQRSLGAWGVSTGAVVLRQAGGRTPWFRAEEMPAGPSGAASDQLLRLFAAHEAIPVSEEGLLESTLALIPGQGLRQLLAYSGEGWVAENAELRIEPGVGASMSVPASVVHVLLSLDGRRSLGAVIEQAAAELGADPKVLRNPGLEVARRLVGLGLATL